MNSTVFREVIKSMIRDSGGSVNKINLEKSIELIGECFMYNSWNFWLGKIIEKSPLDLMILQEIMFEKRPITIIECGTGYGGLAYYMATLMDLMDINGKIITIDHQKNPQMVPNPKKIFMPIDGEIVFADVNLYQKQTLPKHPKIKYIFSDCLAVDFPKLKSKIMVVLDSDNSTGYVYAELEKFSKMVTVGQYLVVANTILADKNTNPAAAVKKFLRNNKNFVADQSREKFGITSSPGGYLLRVS